MRRGVRRSAVLFAAAAGLVVSLAPASSSALEACSLTPATPIWGGFDRNMDAKYGWWANLTPGGCIRIITPP